MYTVTVRSRARVRKERYEQLSDALDAIERIALDLSEGAAARPAGGTFIRKLDPVHQVVGRVELAGPGRVRAGVDVRGDGSSEAFTGRVRRTVVDQRRRESAYDALRRELRG